MLSKGNVSLLEKFILSGGNKGALQKPILPAEQLIKMLFIEKVGN